MQLFEIIEIYTCLIPGKAKKFPIIGIERRKFTAEGKKPLKIGNIEILKFCIFWDKFARKYSVRGPPPAKLGCRMFRQKLL
jgi:hypothetical protein